MTEQNVTPPRNDVTSEILEEIRSPEEGGSETSGTRTSVLPAYEVYSLFTLFTGDKTRRARAGAS